MSLEPPYLKGLVNLMETSNFMKQTTRNAMPFKNIESPFTELFTLLRRYDLLPQGMPRLAYDTKELQAMHQHVGNAKAALTQGLEDIFSLLSVENRPQLEKTVPTLSAVWAFFGVMMNLNDALDTLQSDTAYVLQQRKSV